MQKASGKFPCNSKVQGGSLLSSKPRYLNSMTTYRFVVFITLALIFLLIPSAGCRKNEGPVDTSQSSVEVSTNEEGLKFTSGDDETVVLSEELSEEDLGIPVYPGAVMLSDPSSSFAETDGEGNIKWMTACLETEDTVSEVIKWYKGKLADKPGFSDSTLTGKGTEIGILSFQSGDLETTVTITSGTEYPYETTIQVTSNSVSEKR